MGTQTGEPLIVTVEVCDVELEQDVPCDSDTDRECGEVVEVGMLRNKLAERERELVRLRTEAGKLKQLKAKMLKSTDRSMEVPAETEAELFGRLKSVMTWT